MSKKTKADQTPHRPEEMLQALNAAAAGIQRAARTPEAVFEAVGRELERLGFHSIIVLLDEEKRRFVVRHVTLGAATLAAARKLLGGKLVGYTFPVEQMDLYRQVMTTGQTVYDPQPAQSFPQALPESLRKLVAPITRATSHMRNISAPLTVGGEGVGILSVGAATLVEEDVPTITAFTDQISVTLENAQLYEQVERQRRETATINAIVQALNASLSAKDVFGAVARELGNLVPFDRVSIALGSEDRQSFTMYALAPMSQPDAPLGEGVTMPLAATAAGPDLLAGRPHLTPDLSTEADYPGERLLYEAGLRSRVNVPLQIGDRAIGALNLASTQPAAFSEHHLSLLQHVAGAIAAAIQNAQLYEQVQVSEARYRHLVENVHDLIFEVDTAGVFTYCSPSIEALTGYASDEMIGHSFVEFMHPDDLPVLRESFARTLERGARKPIDFRVLAKDGRAVWVRSLGRQVVRDDEVVGLTGVASDITARKQAEMALQRRDGILRAISFAAEQFLGPGDFDASAHAALARLGEATDVSRVYVFENHAAEAPPSGGTSGILLTSQRYEWVTAGTTPQIDNPDLQNFPWIESGFARWVELLGRNEIIHGLVREFPTSERAILELQDILSIVIVPIFVAGEWWGFIGFDDCRHERTWSPVEVEALRAAARTLGAAIQRQQIEETLRHLKSFHENIVQGIAEGIVIEGAKGHITFVNPALETLLGYTAQELVGQHCAAIVAEDQREKVYQETAKRPHGIASRYETILLNREGQPIPVIVSARPLFDTARDTFVGVLTAFTDITERKAMEEALQRRNEQLAALHEIALDLAAQRALPDLLQAIAARAVDLLAAKTGAILLYRPQTDDLVVAFEYNPTVARIGMISQRGEGLAGQVLETGEPLAVDDYSSWEGAAPEYYVELGIGPDALVGVPIRWGDRLLGMLAVGDDPPRKFTSADVALLERLTPLAAAALEQARLLDEARRRASELGILYEVTTAATTSVDLDTALDSTINALRHALEADNISIQVVEPETGDLVVRAAIGFSSNGSPLVGQRIGAGLGIIGRVVQTNQPALVPNVREDDDYYEYDPATLSELCVPLRVGSQVIGVLDLESHQMDAFTESDLHLVSTLAGNLATVIENARLVQETRHRAETLAALHETALDLAAQRALSDLLQAIVARAVDLLAARGGGIYNYRPETDDLEFVLSYRLGVDYTGTVLQCGEGLSGWVLETGEPLAVEDYSRWEGRSDQYREGDFAATVGVPIRWGDRFLGVLNVLDEAPRTFSTADVALLERFAPLAAAALEQARLLDEAQRRASELGILYDVITAATTSAYLDEVLNQTMDALRQALRVDGIAILLVEPETGDLINRAATGFPGASELIGVRVDAGLGIVGWVAQTSQPALVPDVREDSRYQEYDPDTLSELCVPLRVRSRTIGVLNLESHQLGAFTESDLNLVSTLASNLATVIDNAQLVQTLSESEEKYRTLVKTSPESVTATDLEGRITDLSQRALELHGAKRIEELLGKSAFDLIAPEDRDRAMINVQRTLEEGLVRSVEYTMLRKDGSRFTGELSAALIRDDSGNPQAFIATVRDVTERKRLEEQLRQAQKMEAIGTLAGGIAHDFNNLLGGILGFASLMERDLPADSPLRTSVETIISTARRGAELTNQLLAFARGGRYEVFPTDLNEMTREVVRLLSRTVDKAITIETHLAEELAALEGDAGQLHQMLLNLCLNACEAMPAGGQLIIETENVTLSAKEAQAAMELESGPYVRLRVTDTGIGMDVETMQHIFEPFFTTKKGRPGKQHSGLGLPMVYGIVRSHGGAIRVHSELGQGSTFEVHLPAIEEPATVTAAPTIEATAGSETVLVVDDEDFIRTLLQQALEGAGYTVLLAEDGPQALEIYRQRDQDIDLVVLDMGLPRLSGLETFQQLREIDPQAVVLISSGYAEDDRAQTVLAAGARGFLAKPYDLDELLQKLRAVLNREM